MAADRLYTVYTSRIVEFYADGRRRIGVTKRLRSYGEVLAFIFPLNTEIEGLTPVKTSMYYRFRLYIKLFVFILLATTAGNLVFAMIYNISSNNNKSSDSESYRKVMQEKLIALLEDGRSSFKVFDGLPIRHELYELVDFWCLFSNIVCERLCLKGNIICITGI